MSHLAWSVYVFVYSVCVCLYLGHTAIYAKKTADLIAMPFGDRLVSAQETWYNMGIHQIGEVLRGHVMARCN